MTTPDINEMEKREEAQRLEAEDEIKRLSAINADLLAALEKAAIAMGTAATRLDIDNAYPIMSNALAEVAGAARAAIERAEGTEGPEEWVGPFPRPTGVQRR
jgi:hypothetical protein